MEKSSTTNVSPDIGSWEKHTKGIGLKLLQKFGFNGRLGAKENGVSRAIEVVVRPNNTGLGFGDIKEAASLKVNKKIEAEWRGVEFVDEEEEKKTNKKSSVEKLADAKGWKKNKGNDVHATKLSAADFINKYMNEDSGPKAPQVIIDMRHKDARVITDMSEVGFTDEIPPADAKPKLGQELLYNINILANAEEMSVTRDSRALARLVAKRSSQEEDRVMLQHGIAKESARLGRLQKILLILTRVEEKLNAQPVVIDEAAEETKTKSPVTLSSICGVLRTLHQNFGEEFQIFGLINMLPNLIARVAIADQWDPFVDHAHLYDMYDALAPLVDYFESVDELQLSRLVRKAFSDIIELRYLPVVRRAVASAWDVLEDPQSCVRLFETLQLILPADTFDTTVDMFLIPKLTATVNNWRPSLSELAPAAHTWVHPWIPLLTTKLSALYPEIRRKLGTFLSNMTVSNSSRIVDLLCPWMGVFDNSSFENLLVRSALPKLVSSLRELEVTVSNCEENANPFEPIVAWNRLVPALPTVHIVCLWVGEFFPKWLRFLYVWLTKDPDEVDFSEVSSWYSSWKGLFSEWLLEEEKVTECFAVALEMMQTSLSIDTTTARSENPMLAFEPVLRRIESDNYYSLIDQRKTLVRAQRRLDALQAEESTQYANNLKQAGAPAGLPSRHKQVTFKEVVEEFALRNNIEFVPKIGRLFEGKQLWMFGKTLCYLDQNVVFMSTADKGGKRSAAADAGAASGGDHSSRQELYGWSPVALDDLLTAST